MTEPVPSWAWAATPFSEQQPQGEIVRIGPASGGDFIIVSPRVVGIWTHWHDGRSMPCKSVDGVCQCDFAPNNTKWQGWLAVRDVYGDRVRYLALTDHCAATCPELVRPGVNLRGRLVRVKRSGNSIRGKVSAMLGVWDADERRLPADPDVRRFLARMYGGSMRTAKAEPIKDEVAAVPLPVEPLDFDASPEPQPAPQEKPKRQRKKERFASALEAFKAGGQKEGAA